MTENKNPVAEPQPTEKHCSGDCMNCVPFQRQYCAAQLGYNNMRQMDVLFGEVRYIREKIEAMQNNEATLFNPTIAQEGEGAEE